PGPSLFTRCPLLFPRGSVLGPTKCEMERFTATSFGHPYVPSCRRSGDYEAVQCQRAGPCWCCFAGDCWCVDSRGKELSGSRVRGGRPRCPTDGGPCNAMGPQSRPSSGTNDGQLRTTVARS
uniref:Thyroglobulin type-1 domain-containing protein n=1 Tax=Panthera leo TaxID=9689 RepID=A0A8C8WGA5_PANLE